jgi:AbrB family looped-hinge helix DNA binding protein
MVIQMEDIKTVKISDKGQISIPKDIREALNLKEGETLIMITDGKKITLEKKDSLMKKIRSHEGKDNMLMSEHVLKKDWDNDYDERWNKY